MRDHDISQRRACRLVGVDPKTVRRDQPPDNPEVREEMKAIASKRRRFGYRRIGVLLERKEMTMNHKKLYRLYTEEKLGVRRRRGRKRARGSRTPMPVALRPGERWSLDFVSDTFGASRKFRMLAVNDDCCRENLCLMADTSISGASGCTGTGCACPYLREASLHRLGQWDGVHQSCDPEVGGRERCGLALHRSGKTAAEWLHRKLQWQPERRAAKRGNLRYVRRCPPQTGPLAIRLQQRQTALISGQPNTR